MGLPQVCLVDEERKGVLSTFLWCKLQAVGATNKLISSFPRTGCGLTYDGSDSVEDHGCTSIFPERHRSAEGSRRGSWHPQALAQSNKLPAGGEINIFTLV